MQAVLEQSKQFKFALEWCVLVSITIHLALLLLMPKPSVQPPKPKPPEIQIALVKKEQPAPMPVLPTPPEPPKPPPVKPPPTPVAPRVVPIKPSPTPQPTTPPPVVETPVVDTPKPVIAVKPSNSEIKPELVVPTPVAPPPPPEPPKASGPSEGDIEAARNALKNGATRELKKNQRYPRIALDRGIEGVVKLKISLDGQGNITEVEILESSGNASLDEAAVTAAKKTSLKPYFNEILKGRIDSIVVPVGFSLLKS